MHPMPAPADPVTQGLLLAVLGLAAAGYAAGVARLRRRGDRWPLRRIAAAGLGLGCLTAVTVPPLADGSGFAAHAVRHLLMAMLAPLALALSAPITLALRTFPRGARSAVRHLLGRRWVRLVAT